MFEELESLFTSMKDNINEILVHKEQFNLDQMGVQQAIAKVLSEALVDAGRRAIEQIEEFQYSPLKERLLENLANPKHVLTTRGTIRQKILDENTIGTYSDLLKGWNPTNTPQAPAIWKYGIYLPHLGGGWSDKKISELQLPTYTQVIEERLSAWGDKAPYWWFLENGNAGNSRAYPNFSGTSYFAQLRNKTLEIVINAKKYFNERLFYDLDFAINLGINIQPKSKTRVTIFKYSIGGTNISVQKSSAGNIFYRIGNKTFTVSEFERYVKSLL